jgi:transposase
MKSISLYKQQKILSLLQDQRRLSSRQIAILCDVDHKTVQNYCRRHLPDLTLPPRGRPQKLSPQDKHHCIRSITSGKLKTAIAVQQDLETNLDVKVDESTVRRALKDAGLQAEKKEKRPKLSDKNIKERLEFAKQHKD